MSRASRGRILFILVMPFFVVFSQGGEMKEAQEKSTAADEKTQDSGKTGDHEGMSVSQVQSYAIGADIGNYLAVMKDEIDLEMFMKGLGDVLEGRNTLLSADEVKQAQQEFMKKIQEKQRQESEAIAEKNLKEGEAFLAENKNKEGVKTTESGLQYMVLKEGDGPVPKAEDTVKVHYKGMLIDGTEFDSSLKRGEPASFGVSRVIKGWTEALQLMKVGSQYKLFIPADLAYGTRGAGRDIPPNSVLIFEVELLGIE